MTDVHRRRSYEDRHIDTEGRCNETIRTEIGVMQPQAKECLGLLATTRS